jgi:hypothetical protein
MAFYCVKMCKDFAQNFGRKRTSYCGVVLRERAKTSPRTLVAEELAIAS